jgi:aldehyde:ferredoxin oxidoreductase
MSVRARIDELLPRLASERQFPTQGQTLFVDLERQEVRRAYIPRAVVSQLLGGRGVNMFLLYNLLDPSLDPLHPDVPLIFGTGILTSLVPSASRGNVTSWSPESKVIMDSNAGDYFPSFMKLNAIDHLVLYGKARQWTLLHFAPSVIPSREDGEESGSSHEGRDSSRSSALGMTIKFIDAKPWVGLDNIALREKIAAHFNGAEGKDYGLAAITTAGENLVLCSGIMAGPKAIYARGGPGAKMGSLHLKAVLIQGRTADLSTAHPHKVRNREVAQKLLGTSVVKNALKKRGTPFLYKPSRMLGAMGTKNNQETTWTDKLDAENIDPFRPGMEGCFACPVNCRPLNDMTGCEHVPQDQYVKGDGPEYVTVGKFGPNVGITEVTQVLRLNNICNDLGLDTASTGSAISWAMELYQRGMIECDLDLRWGNYDVIEKLLFMTAKREGFGDVIADSSRAVELGKYPEAALDYLMAVKGLTQSDPHDARILKAFALGLAVATRGMDHLRNRVTLEINAKINDDPEFKRELYGGAVAAEPNSYDGKEIAVRRCENTFAVGDAVGMCRFTTKLFNSPSLPGYEEFADQVVNVTGIDLTKENLDEIGLNIMGVERLINARLGVTRKDDTLPKRWFEEAIGVGPFKGEKIDRQKFDDMLSRFYAISRLDEQGLPLAPWKAELESVLTK